MVRFVRVVDYREVVRGCLIIFVGVIGAGVLMMLVSCACYVAMWEVLVATVEKNFAHDYATSMVKRAQNSGLQGAALEAKLAEVRRFEETYSNPLYRMAMTLLEPLPVGIVLALVTAGVLRREPGLPGEASTEVS